ncbi:MAG: DNA cytosine methyltransferase [Candidatus Aminicenantes bacterium]|nr:DNA cytosine methyltransferase [Candidatus Aminicenantes bacterium]
MNKNDSSTPVLSFFTGGGFLDMGFERAGFHVSWTNESNKAFTDMYSYGMTQWRRSLNASAEAAKISNKRSITKVFAPEILREAFPEGGLDFFGIIGGPPCPDFSVGGGNKGASGINGRLTEIFINRICKIIPSFFVFENVRGLFKTKIHREFLLRLEKRLESKGFCLDLKILNALDFGVPQDRERLIMIGIQKKYTEACLGRSIKKNERRWFPWPEIPKYADAKHKFNWPSIEKKDQIPAKRRGVPLKLTVYYHLNESNSPLEELNGNDIFKPYSAKFLTVCEGDTKRKSFKRLHRYRYSPTVCYGHNEVHLHPWENRRLSVREAMRIQGIPDEYALPEDASLTNKFSLVSNGVPVPLAYELAVSLREFFKAEGLFKGKQKMKKP